jgi:hypothetical protein
MGSKLEKETFMARIVRFHQTGAPDVLKIEQVNVPAPGVGHSPLTTHHESGDPNCSKPRTTCPRQPASRRLSC